MWQILLYGDVLRLMQVIQAYPFKGLVTDIPARRLTENYQPVALNVEYEHGSIKTRDGLRLFHDGVQNEIIYIMQYKPLYYSKYILLIFTASDIYWYDDESGRFMYATPRYKEGTATTNPVDNTVTVAGGDWSGFVNNQYYIGLGSEDPNEITEWYKITSFTSSTQCSLETTPQTYTNVQYCIRRCFKNISGAKWSVASVLGSDGEVRVMATNWYDCPVIWDGVPAQGIGDGFFRFVNIDSYTFRARYISKMVSRVIMAHTQDTGAVYPNTIRVSDPNNPDLWSEAINFGLMTDPSDIIGMFSFKGVLFVCKRNTISVFYETFDVDSVLQFEENKYNIGILNNDCVAIFDDCVIVAARDDIYLFDGANFNGIGRGAIYTTVKERMNNNVVHKMFAVADAFNKKYYLFYADGASEEINAAMCYDIKNAAWSMVTFGAVRPTCGFHGVAPDKLESYQNMLDKNITCEYLKIAMPNTTYSDYMYPNIHLGYNYFGSKTGNVYTQAPGYSDDNGEAINATFETNDHPLNTEKQEVLFKEIIISANGRKSGVVAVSASTDEGVSWTPEQIVDLSGDSNYIEQVVKTYVRGKRIRVKVRNVQGDPFYIEGLLFGYEDLGYSIRG